MRPTLALLALVSGCAATDRDYAVEHGGASACLLDRDGPATTAGPLRETSRLALYLDGRRVPGDDLVLATSTDERARDLALRSRHDEQTGIAALVSGGLLLGSGASLFGFGDDHDQKAAVGAGAALLAVSGGTLLAGAIVVAHARDERARAVVAYNQDAAPGCR